MKDIWQEFRLMIGQKVIWQGILICGRTGFGDEILVAFRNAVERDANRLRKELNQ